MSDSVRPHRRQPTRLPHPWDSPGKNTGVGCHFLLQCRGVESESEVAQLCLTLSDPMDSAHKASPRSMGFSRQEYWCGVPLSSPIVLLVHQKIQPFVLLRKRSMASHCLWNNSLCHSVQDSKDPALINLSSHICYFLNLYPIVCLVYQTTSEFFNILFSFTPLDFNFSILNACLSLYQDRAQVSLV